MSVWIEIEEPIRQRYCHRCRRAIKGKHLRVYVGSGSGMKYANICWKCIGKVAEELRCAIH